MNATVLSSKSWVTLVNDAVTCDAASFESCADVLKRMPQTPDPMNPKTFLRRRQGTFGAVYDFKYAKKPHVRLNFTVRHLRTPKETVE